MASPNGGTTPAAQIGLDDQKRARLVGRRQHRQRTDADQSAEEQAAQEQPAPTMERSPVDRRATARHRRCAQRVVRGSGSGGGHSRKIDETDIISTYTLVNGSTASRRVLPATVLTSSLSPRRVTASPPELRSARGPMSPAVATPLGPDSGDGQVHPAALLDRGRHPVAKATWRAPKRRHSPLVARDTSVWARAGHRCRRGRRHAQMAQRGFPDHLSRRHSTSMTCRPRHERRPSPSRIDQQVGRPGQKRPGPTLPTAPARASARAAATAPAKGRLPRARRGRRSAIATPAPPGQLATACATPSTPSTPSAINGRPAHPSRAASAAGRPCRTA